MADPLASARLKLERANLHAATLNDETRAFLNAHEKPTFEGRFKQNFTRYVIHVRTGYPEPPASFGLIFGDAIHNYRSALDHLAWQLVLHGDQPTPRRPTDVQFPIYRLRRDFDGNIKRRLPGVDGDALKFIKSRNAKPRWNSRYNVLLHLAKWSNEDKHRNVQLVTAGLHSLYVRPLTSDCINRGFAFKRRTPPKFKKGAVVTALVIQPTGPNPKVHMPAVSVLATVSLPDGLIATAVLDEIRAEVELILNAREVVAALT